MLNDMTLSCSIGVYSLFASISISPVIDSSWLWLHRKFCLEHDYIGSLTSVARVGLIRVKLNNL